MATTRKRKSHDHKHQQQQQPQEKEQSSTPAPRSAQNSRSDTGSQQTLSSSSSSSKDHQEGMNSTTILSRQPVWVVLAIASGACAAINGVFAKLTTTSLTSTLSSHISKLLGLAADNNYVNVTLRGSFFGLNLLFNGIMWGLFTAALAKGSSTTRVSIVNVSANFFITAILGWLIFSEKLPLQWWMGAALLACGNVVIGRREEAEKPDGSIRLSQSTGAGQTDGLLGSDEDVDGDLLELDATSTRLGTTSHDEALRLKKGEDADAPL